MSNTDQALANLKLMNRIGERLTELGVPFSLQHEAFQKMKLGGILCVDRTTPDTTRLSFIKAKGAA
jgi:hypothetical protein